VVFSALLFFVVDLEKKDLKGRRATTMPPRKSAFSYRKTIIASSRRKYGTPRNEVEREIMMRYAENNAVPSAKQPSLI